MPNYVSHGGEWHPAKERVALKNISGKTIKNPSDASSKFANEEIKPGEDFIYEGADRAALYELWLNKSETLGMDFRQDAELINRVRQLGYKSVAEYAKLMGYDANKAKEEFDKKATVVVKHDLPAKVEAINTLGGGNDSSGSGNDRFGDFGVPKEL